jgi:hypothetical protein
MGGYVEIDLKKGGGCALDASGSRMGRVGEGHDNGN